VPRSDIFGVGWRRLRKWVHDAAVPLGLPDSVRGCLFDLDGVLTKTAIVHAKAWKQTFDEFLENRAGGNDFHEFTDQDYIDYVDGKPRENGVHDFLASRGINLPMGERSDRPNAQTVWGVGNRKNELLLQLIERDGIEVYPDAVRYLERARTDGLRCVVVSSSANTATVLKVTDLSRYFEGRVDGVTLAKEHLRGKPAPDSFEAGARLLRLPSDECVVFEDAISGVTAGQAAGCYVIGVDRVRDGKHGDSLRTNGADMVVKQLTELLDTGAEDSR
jgi:beta-phosphoglucomutase family hydrolase